MNKLYVMDEKLKNKIINGWKSASEQLPAMLDGIEKKIEELKSNKNESEENRTRAELASLEKFLCDNRKGVGQYSRGLKPTLNYLKDNPSEMQISSEELEALNQITKEADIMYRNFTSLIESCRTEIRMIDLKFDSEGNFEFLGILERMGLKK